MIRRILMATLTVSAAAVPVAARADSPAAYRSVALSTSNATVTPGRCSTSTRAAVYYTDPGKQGPPAGSGITVTSGTGATAAIVSSAAAWRNGVSSVTYSLRLPDSSQAVRWETAFQVPETVCLIRRVAA